jgi:segregation and condensation protein A
MTKDFKQLETNRHEFYTKPPESLKEYAPEGTILNSDLSLDDLMKAFQKFLERKELEKPIETKITTREISIEERSRDIKKILKSKKKVSFFELFKEKTREYVVVTFLTVLEMAKNKEIIITQENNFNEIYVSSRDGENND